MAFADIGKAFKDVSGGYTFDHKASWSSKTGFGSVAGSASYVTKSGAFPVEAKATYKLGGATSVDASVTDAGKVTATFAKDDLLAGLKAKVTAVLAGGSDASLGLTYAWAKAPLVGGTATLVSDVGLAGSKAGKVSGALGWASGSLTLGGDAELAGGELSKYSLGAQTVLSNGGTAAALLADKASTLRLSYVHKCSATVNGGVEAVHKLDKGDTSFSLAASKKISGGSAKALATSAGAVSLLLSKDVQPNKATATVAMQLDAFDLSKAPKVGVQLTLK